MSSGGRSANCHLWQDAPSRNWGISSRDCNQCRRRAPTTYGGNSRFRDVSVLARRTSSLVECPKSGSGSVRLMPANQLIETTRRTTSDRLAMRVTSGILFAAFLALVVLVVTSPHRFLYDEPYFVEYIPLLHQHGFTTKFLNSLTGTVGPLYALVHAVFEPATHLEPVRMRLVNVILLGLVAGLLAAWLKRQGRPDYRVAGCSVPGLGRARNYLVSGKWPLFCPARTIWQSGSDRKPDAA